MLGARRRPRLDQRVHLVALEEIDTRALVRHIRDRGAMRGGVFPAAMGEAEARFKGEDPGFVYSRYANPTVSMFEERMCLLEGAEAHPEAPTDEPPRLTPRAIERTRMSRSRERILANLEDMYREAFERAKATGDQSAQQQDAFHRGMNLRLFCLGSMRAFSYSLALCVVKTVDRITVTEADSQASSFLSAV